MSIERLRTCQITVADALRRVAAGEEIDAVPIFKSVRALNQIIEMQPRGQTGLEQNDLKALLNDLETLESAIQSSAVEDKGGEGRVP
jgi:hypothetical protein